MIVLHVEEDGGRLHLMASRYASVRLETKRGASIEERPVTETEQELWLAWYEGFRSGLVNATSACVGGNA